MKLHVTKIHKPDFLYFLLKSTQIIAFKAFYKKIEVKYRKNIPYGNPIIFTPNHQNALMDALAVLNTCGMNPVFMARADIFRKKRQAKILSFLKVLPIYRIRDGADELSKNSEIFDTAIAILKDKKAVCLMPEGNHGYQRRLRQLVKGSFRIAFNAQETFSTTLDVKIVPVGIDYEHYQKFHQDLLIIYGQAIDVKAYMDLYRENPPRAINILRDKLSEELKKIMIHIENEEYYDMYHEMRSIYNKRMRNRMGIFKSSHYYRFLADKEIIRVLDQNFTLNPELIKSLSVKVNEYAVGLKKLNLRNWVFDKKGYSTPRVLSLSFLLILFVPLFLFGWLNNIIPYTIPQRKIRNVKDPQFHSSFKFALAFVIFPVYYAIIGVAVRIISGSGWIPWAYITVSVLAGYFALYYSFIYKKLRSALRYLNLLRRSDPEILNLISLHNSIISTMNDLTEENQKRYLPENKITTNVK